MNFRSLCIGSITLLLLAGPAAADARWTAATSPTLLAHSNEPESDRSLFAVCASRGVVELYIGADEQVGKGEGDAVKVRVESDGKSATVSGTSRRSANFQMTAGTELVTRVGPNDEFFKVLATGKPVKVSGSLSKSATWNDRGMAEAVRKFVKDCGPR